MKTTTAIALAAMAALAGPAIASGAGEGTRDVAIASERTAEELIDLSRQKWIWMADRNVDALAKLFHPQARFVHMSRTMNRDEELEVIRSGNIEYKLAEIRDISAESMGDAVIVYSRIRLTAVVGGNEVINPFSVTETYLHRDGRWVLAGMAFSRLVGD